MLELVAGVQGAVDRMHGEIKALGVRRDGEHRAVDVRKDAEHQEVNARNDEERRVVVARKHAEIQAVCAQLDALVLTEQKKVRAVLEVWNLQVKAADHMCKALLDTQPTHEQNVQQAEDVVKEQEDTHRFLLDQLKISDTASLKKHVSLSAADLEVAKGTFRACQAAKVTLEQNVGKAAKRLQDVTSQFDTAKQRVMDFDEAWLKAYSSCAGDGANAGTGADTGVIACPADGQQTAPGGGTGAHTASGPHRHTTRNTTDFFQRKKDAMKAHMLETAEHPTVAGDGSNEDADGNSSADDDDDEELEVILFILSEESHSHHASG
jgi:hypothetical protein